MTRNNVSLTKSGLFVREDIGFGLLVYSPYLGLIFACLEKDSERIIMWLDKKVSQAPSVEYEKALGPGWAIPLEEVEYTIPHLLPNSDAWQHLATPNRPILINWLITGDCPLVCQYCYAEDLMRGKCHEPDELDIERISESILSFNPLVVVLTGGDPLSSPYLTRAIELLHKRTGIIIDTNAYIFNSTHLELFKKYNTFVRISMDSERPGINDRLRPVSSEYRKLRRNYNTVEAAINALCQCIEVRIGVAVQTVATKMNFSDLEPLGDKLYKLGVNGWRILMVAPSKDREKVCEKLAGTKKARTRFYEYIRNKLFYKFEKDWNRRMSLQVAQNATANAVILVSPDGTFLTESNVGPRCKVTLDEDHPKKPRLILISDKVSMHAHAERYLNLNI